MDTNDNSNEQSHIDRAAIARRVAAYHSKKLTDAQNGLFLPALRELVLETHPESEQEAIGVLSSACSLISDVASNDANDIHDLLTEQHVSVWSHQQKAKNRSAGTLANDLCRLNRLLRVKSGLPARIRSISEKPARVVTHSVDEITNVVDYLASIDASAAVVVLAGITCGVFPHAAVGGYFSTNDVSTTFMSDEVANEILPEFSSTALRLQRIVVDNNAWTRVRSGAKSRDLTLDAHLLRRLWVVGLLSLRRPLAEIIACGSLSLQALKSAVPDLPECTHAEYDLFLRGA